MNNHIYIYIYLTYILEYMKLLCMHTYTCFLLDPTIRQNHFLDISGLLGDFVFRGDFLLITYVESSHKFERYLDI